MYLSLECDTAVYVDTRKHIAKLVKWCNKISKQYYEIISSVDGCVLVTNELKVIHPAWCTFTSLNTDGDIEKLEIKKINIDVMTDLTLLTDKIEGFKCVIETFDSNPIGIHPFFLFKKKGYTYGVVINRDNSVDIHVSGKN